MNLPPRFDHIATAIASASAESALDPCLVAAVIDRESAAGKALAPDGTGDHGHGLGLMQIDARYHSAWAAANDWRDPLTNIRKGCEILKAALANFPKNLQAGVCCYNASPGRVRTAVFQGKSPDVATTGGDYGSWVLKRAADFRAASAMNLTHTEQT